MSNPNKGRLDAAKTLLGLIRMDRQKIINSENAIIPAAIDAGLLPEKIAELSGVPIERVRELAVGGDG